MRKEGLEEIFRAGKIEGGKGRGRLRLHYMGSLCKWMQAQVPEDWKENAAVQKVLTSCKDKVLWKSMVTYVLRGHDT